jgi:demethylmenaquinone methyltransferase/2-methoxy-6-polyprenyl-1,4-benzoquinol methylase
MATPAAQLDKRGETIQQMFAGVAPRYDLLNHLLSASMDRRWRALSARSLAPRKGELILDLCCGTGDQALTISPSGARVVAADFCVPMLALAKEKFGRTGEPRPLGMASDALALPYSDAVFNGAVVSFGLRNVADLDGALHELARVLRPGGRLSILEFMAPARQPLRTAYLFYFRRILPFIGRIVSPRGSAYSYLPASVLQFPQREAFLDRMRSAGFEQAEYRSLTGGIVGLYSGEKRA